ncbi:hypothetical protein SAMN05444283_15312 [Bacteroides stercoris]|nr:hypothetical protein SAMN05444283_15312 [Bacteroides stercoris]
MDFRRRLFIKKHIYMKRDYYDELAKSEILDH